ncbi:cholera enterotoxin subunit A2 [Beauveria bassiana ARSEF 2860]|uniref:Cholera enterotoxin subunit A2 n=1 Tax=Beauveria bassiana (strain ARSEF 2860) TaxID=655819 RepID=J5JBB8_BEAB2|nr:cholera enterotoxin subunit A2 [Beauveria bassiana ARSEF 2860]EJP61236.1 cholera enterotoxin subunit A2 [Beauveria bassiana ARSEF 2860]
MIKAWSWAAAALAYVVIPAHCATMTVPKNNLALETKYETKLFRFDIPEGNLSGLEDYISLQKRQEALPSVLYRGSGSSPEDVKARGGFIPREEGGPIINETFGLRLHHLGYSRTVYTSTSRSFGVALGYSLKGQDDGWIYKIQPTPNMIDLNGSGFKLQFTSEEEFSALGGIHYDQIEAWMPLSKSDLKEKLTMAHVYEFHDFETFSAKNPEKKWTVNPDYNQNYDSLAASPGQPQLAGDPDNLDKYNDKTLEEYATEFMQKNGAAVGWDGTFPLSSLKTPESPSEPVASLPAQTPSTGKPNPWAMEAELCATGPDGKGKYGMDRDECHIQVAQCVFEAQGSPDANWETITKCMDTKF